MLFKETEIPGVFLIEPERCVDTRDFFARTWCRHEFAACGLNTNLVQCSVSFNEKQATLRGMHYQVALHEEAKLVRCTRGAIYDVVLDLRTASRTYKKWTAAELTADNHCMVYVPPGCAHGFLTLRDNTEVFYQMSEFYHPESACGIRWDDPDFGIIWPRPASVISKRDSSFPFSPRETE